ncbi:spore photoproduct lyase family protein [Kaarinaea lacus]
MFPVIYIENDIVQHPLTQEIIRRFDDTPLVYIERYGEVFNRKSQNFRLQKQKPALILARKHNNWVLPAPAGYGFGDGESYYFSHMLNCIYDCRYCFLQGMYRSAHYVLFVNFEDFAAEIENKISQKRSESIYFYSGYDCDSMALEPISGFAKYFLPLFSKYQNSWLELRTKSTQIRDLLTMPAIVNGVIAYSFTPEDISQQLEHKVPSLEKRIDAVVRLQQHGWPVALRFEPLIFQQQMAESYQSLFIKLFQRIHVEKLHSVSLGLFRMPNDFFNNIVKLYPDEPLFARDMVSRGRLTSYPENLEQDMVSLCESELLNYVPKEIYYRCVESQ